MNTFWQWPKSGVKRLKHLSQAIRIRAEREKMLYKWKKWKGAKRKNSVEVSTIKKSHTLARDSLRKMELHKEAIKICNLSTVCM